MIKQTITFTDFDGNEVTEDHYFHLSKKELIAMELAEEGGLGETLQRVVKSGDARKIIEYFEVIVSKAYGRRDPQNPSKFTKTSEISEEFMSSLAYDAFFSELLTNSQTAINFINGMVPKDLISQLQAIDGEGGSDQKPVDQVETEADEDQRSGLRAPRNANGELLPWAFRKPFPKELQAMTKAQLVDVTNRMSGSWQPTVQG